MSRRTCFMIFVAALVVIMASYIFNFSPVTVHVGKTFSAMQGIYLALSAIIISLLLVKQKYYWLLILGCAVLAAILIQWLVVGGAVMSIALLYKIAAFVVYAYLIMLIRHMMF